MFVLVWDCESNLFKKGNDVKIEWVSNMELFSWRGHYLQALVIRKVKRTQYPLFHVILIFFRVRMHFSDDLHKKYPITLLSIKLRATTCER